MYNVPIDVGIAVVVDALAGVLAGAIIGVATNIGVDLLPDIKANALPAVMTAVKFITIPAALEEASLFC